MKSNKYTKNILNKQDHTRKKKFQTKGDENNIIKQKSHLIESKTERQYNKEKTIDIKTIIP